MPIIWPERFDPARAPVHVLNEIDVPTSCDPVWAWLVRAQLWPSWYDNSADMQFVNIPGPDLRPEAEFSWRTFGVRVKSTVQEFDPPFRLAWSAKGMGVDAYHAWLLEPTLEGCHVITEESQYGALARTGNLLMPNRMSQGHQRWLEALRDNAVRGLPPQI
jgi:hypothetical protein